MEILTFFDFQMKDKYILTFAPNIAVGAYQ